MMADFSFLHQPQPDFDLEEDETLTTMSSTELEQEFPLALSDAIKEFGVKAHHVDFWRVAQSLEDGSIRVVGYVAKKGKEK